MKRRPHQQYYKPGSGILRKSSSGIEESESDTNLLFNSKQNNIKISLNVESKFKSEGNSPRNTQQNMDKVVEKFGDVNIRDQNKKSKKPDQEIYVPRHVAHNKKFEQDTSRTVTQKKDDYSHEHEVIGDHETNLHGYSNGNDRRFDSQSSERFNSNKSKRYSNKRRGNDSREEWSDKSRQIRQGSEPRGINNSNREANNWQRTRDTRSVEPSGPSSSASNYGDKSYTNKPPSGRRHSTICLERLNELPPRFRKKMMEEGQFKNVNLPEEGWDGSSLTFQGTNTTNTQSSGYSPVDSYQSNHGSYATLPNSHTHQNQGPLNQNIGYLTLPGRSRGRGRLMNYDQYDYSSVNRQIDTKSPCNSRPPTPPSYSCLKENPGRPTSRPHTPSYNRRNDYNRSSDDKYHSLSRQSSQERYRRNIYGDGYESRRSVDNLSHKNNEERIRNNEDRFSNNEERHRNNDDRYRNNDDRHRNNDDRHRNNDDRFRNNNDRHRNNDDRLRNNDNRHKNNNERHRNNEHRYRNKDDFHQKRRDDPRSHRRHDDDLDHKGQGEPRTGNYREHRDQFGSNGAQEVTADAKLLTLPKDDTEQKPKRSSLDALLSPVSPPTSIAETSEAALPVRTDVLDWSEEVEMNYKLESEAQSDALTRSSSVASLVESNATLVPTHSNVNNVNTNLVKKSKRTKRKTKLKGRSRSGRRNGSRERQFDSHTFDNFKVPAEPRRRKLSDRRDSSRSSRAHSRDSSFDRTWRMSSNDHENWRDEIRQRQEHDKGREITRSRQNSEDSQTIQRISGDLSNIDVKKAGVLVIQQPKPQENASGTTPPSLDHPRYAEARRQPSVCKTKSLFDPNNPDKPIIVKSSNARADPGIPEIKEMAPLPADYDQFGNICPSWYREGSEENRLSHYPAMINDVKRADQQIQYAIHSGIFLKNWTDVEIFRQFLRESLQYFLCKDLKFSQTGNIEQHFWKLLYYNIIERIRGAIQKDEANREHYKQFVLFLVDEGTQYFESLLNMLEETYDFQLNDYLGANQSVPQKGLGYVGLALISAQKIFIFLGDLARYKEQINETTNYGKCRHWYIKAHEINPKNGRPYKKLAVLAVFARRKLDAVYYYMRSLMSSNPIYPARDKLNALFYENSKKYEQGEKRRREEKLERARKHMMEKESQTTNQPTSIRRETWIRPDGGKRVHRTTQAVQSDEDSEEQNLASLSSVEVNKRFVISYLHVHGKLITRIGMESFQEAAMQMLKEFRALLQHSPLPLPTNRLLQLLALNMFAIESTQLKDPELQQHSGYRSEPQERALVISLQMFNLILERCVSLLEEHLASKPENLNAISMDAQLLMPPVKIWCDWMLCHSSVWNPPPSTQDFKIGTPGDVWTRLAMLINYLGQLDQTASEVFSSELLEDYVQLRLPEDSVLSGFTPLMVNMDEPTYVPKNYDMESAQFVLRLNKLLFFGTEFLCGLEPPVLKLEIDNDFQEYISVVSNSNSRNSPQNVPEMRINNEVLSESFSDDEECPKMDSLGEDTSSEVLDLLSRKVELERKHKSHELHMERVKKILSQSVISVHIDILPKYLVPDTNCFIDHLDRIAAIINLTSSPYTIMVPIVVLGELEGLSRGGKSPIPGIRSSLDPDHVRKVGDAARKALTFLKNRHSNLKSVTTRGAVFNSTTFTAEDDATSSCAANNDDKILTCCLNLSKIHEKEQPSSEDEPRQLFREVVLLTDDRNLRVKALSTDVPVRELPDFMKWAGLG